MNAEDLGIDNVLEVLVDRFELIGEVIHDEFLTLCVHPDHHDTKPSCSINLETGLWQCFSCGQTGDILTLGKHVLGKPRKKIKELLSPQNVDAQLALAQRKLKRILRSPGASTSDGNAKEALRERLWLPENGKRLSSYEDGPFDYLIDRGFTEETINRWGCRFVKRAEVPGKDPDRPIEIANSIAIPVCDARGRLIMWTYRATDSSYRWQRERTKYLNTYGAPKEKVWFGLHLHRSASEIVVVEGPLDAMWLDQCGVPAVAMMGSSMTRERAAMLESFGKATLFFDRDVAGVRATARSGQVLWYRMPTYVARYPKKAKGQDPQGLKPNEVSSALSRSVPWTAWRQKHLPTAPLFDKVTLARA